MEDFLRLYINKLLSILMIVQRVAIQSSLLFCKFTLHVSGVNHTHHQDYTKLQLPPSNVAKLAWPRWREVAAQKI